MTDILKAIRWNLIEHFIIAQPSGGSGGAASPQVGPGQHPGGMQGAKPPKASEIWHFWVPNRGQKLLLLNVF